MKKRIAVFFAMLVVLAASLSSVLTASAYTQEDLLEEFKTIPASHWVLDGIENLSKTMELTEEQCNQLWPILQEVKKLVPEDNGPTVYQGTNHNNGGRAYSAEVVAKVLDYIREACKITGCTFVKSLVSEPTHGIDIVFKLYNKEGKLIFEYDGDLVKQTGGEVETEDGGAWLLIGGVSMLVLAAGAALAGRKARREAVAA